jgi:hypothetical protein
MKLSEHLSLKEVIKSNTATRRGISNQPTQQHLQNLVILAKEVFEPIRVHFNEPIYVSSGYRSRELNKAIGGSKTSQHCKGEALDLDQDYRNTCVSNRDIYFFIKDNLDFDQLIWEGGNDDSPAWVHVSFSAKKNRKQLLRI